MTLDILEFNSKFYLIFDICSDSENDSYNYIRVSRAMQLFSLHYRTTTTVLPVMYFYGDL